jgi:hypothetical protein
MPKTKKREKTLGGQGKRKQKKRSAKINEK